MNRIVICFGMAVGFALSASLPMAQSSTIKLGASLQLSGSLANTERCYRDAYDLAVCMINDQGGVTVAAQKYKLALRLLDNQ